MHNECLIYEDEVSSLMLTKTKQGLIIVALILWLRIVIDLDYRNWDYSFSSLILWPCYIHIVDKILFQVIIIKTQKKN